MAYYNPQIDRREGPVDLRGAACLFIDVQNYNCHRGGAIFRYFSPEQLEGPELQYFWDRIDHITPNLKRLQSVCRECGVEAMYTVIQSLTKDGRDRSMDYKISGFHVPPGSWDGKVMDCIQPGSDEIVLPKTSSSVFLSTNIDYILRCMDKKHLIICGCLTDQCVEHAVRDACDLGYFVTLVPDCCATYSEERHARSLQAVKGYCRIRTCNELVDEFRSLRSGHALAPVLKPKRPYPHPHPSHSGALSLPSSPHPDGSGGISPGNGEPNGLPRPKRERKIYFEFAKKQWETEEEFRLPGGGHAWVEVSQKGDPGTEQRGLVFCRLCRENGRSNIFAKGYTGGKRSALKEHMTTKDHKDALRSLGHDPQPSAHAQLTAPHPDHAAPSTSSSPRDTATTSSPTLPLPDHHPSLASDWERASAALAAAAGAVAQRPLLPGVPPLDSLARPPSQPLTWPKLDHGGGTQELPSRKGLPPSQVLPAGLQPPAAQQGAVLRKPPPHPHAPPGAASPPRT